MRKKLFSMLALLCLTAVSAWADDADKVTVTQTANNNEWTVVMPAGNVVLQVEYELWKVTPQTNNAEWGTVEAVAGGGVKELTASDVNAWNGDNTTLSAADLPGFAEVTTEQALAWDGYPGGSVYLIYGFDGEKTKRLSYYNTSTPNDAKYVKTRDDIYRDINSAGHDRWFYTTGSGVTANTDGTYSVAVGKSITLKATPKEGYTLEGWYKVDGSDVTPLTEGIDAEAGTLTLTPEADMTVRAEFAELTYTVTLVDKTYGSNANVTATVGGTDATITDDGTITGVKPSQTVILKANNGYKFRKVEAKEGSAEEAAADHSLTITDVAFYYNDGESWKQAIENHPTQNAGWSIDGNTVKYNGNYTLCKDDWSGAAVMPR